jgi:hypothetical protein
VSRTVRKWNFGINSSYSKAHIENISTTDSNNSSYSVSLAHQNLGLSGSYSRGSGSGVQVGNGIVPNTEIGPLPLTLFHGDSYGGGINYRPLRRWTMSATYSKLKYDTLNQDQNQNSTNTSEQFFARSDYHFRQMDFNFGYSHLTQGFGTGQVKPTTIDTIFFGVSRRFDIF